MNSLWDFLNFIFFINHHSQCSRIIIIIPLLLLSFINGKVIYLNMIYFECDMLVVFSLSFHDVTKQ